MIGNIAPGFANIAAAKASRLKGGIEFGDIPNFA